MKREKEMEQEQKRVALAAFETQELNEVIFPPRDAPSPTVPGFRQLVAADDAEKAKDAVAEQVFDVQSTDIDPTEDEEEEEEEKMRDDTSSDAESFTSAKVVSGAEQDITASVDDIAQRVATSKHRRSNLDLLDRSLPDPKPPVNVTSSRENFLSEGARFLKSVAQSQVQPKKSGARPKETADLAELCPEERRTRIASVSDALSACPRAVRARPRHFVSPTCSADKDAKGPAFRPPLDGVGENQVDLPALNLLVVAPVNPFMPVLMRAVLESSPDLQQQVARSILTLPTKEPVSNDEDGETTRALVRVQLQYINLPEASQSIRESKALGASLPGRAVFGPDPLGPTAPAPKRVLVDPDGNVDPDDPLRVAREHNGLFEHVRFMPKFTGVHAKATAVVFVMPPRTSAPDEEAQLDQLCGVASGLGEVPASFRPLLVFMGAAGAEDERVASLVDMKVCADPFLPDIVQKTFLDLVRKVHERLQDCDFLDEDTPAGTVSPLPWTHGGVVPRLPPGYTPRDDWA